MTSRELRQSFLDFFAQRDHKIMPGSPLKPTDETTLFTSAGMQQFVPWFRGIVPAGAPRGGMVGRHGEKGARSGVRGAGGARRWPGPGKWIRGSTRISYNARSTRGRRDKKNTRICLTSYNQMAIIYARG